MFTRALLITLAWSSSPALATCQEPRTGTKTIPVLSPPLGAEVVGSGRLQFHSAPNQGCVMEGVFVIPRDQLIAYAESKTGWTSVMYARASGGEVMGWVRTARLKYTGSMGPR